MNDEPAARTCEHCGTEYQPASPTQAYCRHACAKAARKRRAKDRKQLAEILNGHMCPRPRKRAYRTWEEASLQTFELSHGMQAYRCRCGAIHYGHLPKRLQPVGATA